MYYDFGFEVLQWLLFLSAVPPAQLLKAWCVTVKVLPDISAISALTAVKHGSYKFPYRYLNPVRIRKIIDMAMNGVWMPGNRPHYER